jgi:hypothetical protein
LRSGSNSGERIFVRFARPFAFTLEPREGRSVRLLARNGFPFLLIDEYQTVIKKYGMGPALDEPGHDPNVGHGRTHSMPPPNIIIRQWGSVLRALGITDLDPPAPPQPGQTVM